MTMLRSLLVFAAISVVYSQSNCPLFPSFSSFPNGNDLLSKLDGIFFMAYTSATLVNCHKMNYVLDANNVKVGYIESPGCCVQIGNFNFNSNLNQLDYTIGPLSGYQTSCSSLVNENGSMKLLSTTGTGNSLCLIVAVCQADYYGLLVFCRGQPPLLTTIIVLLIDVLGLLYADQIYALRPVSQTNCVFPSNNCPAY